MRQNALQALFFGASLCASLTSAQDDDAASFDDSNEVEEDNALMKPIFHPNGDTDRDSRNHGTPTVIVFLFLAIATGMLYVAYREVTKLRDEWLAAAFTMDKHTIAAKSSKDYKSYRTAFRELDAMEMSGTAKKPKISLMSAFSTDGAQEKARKRKSVATLVRDAQSRVADKIGIGAGRSEYEQV
jgi:hypothetical protein